MIKDYLRSLSHFSDSRFWRPILWASLLSLGLISCVVFLVGASIYQLVDYFSSELTTSMEWADGWLQSLCALIGTFFIGVLGYFFLASLYAAFISLFIDDLLDLVHAQNYPETSWVKPPGIIHSFLASLRLILWSLLVYTLASPFLLLGYFIPPLGLALQFLLGGFLLGREYGLMVEQRIPKDLRNPKPKSLSHGIFALVLWSVPPINLIAPLLLAISLVHSRLGKA